MDGLLAPIECRRDTRDSLQEFDTDAIDEAGAMRQLRRFDRRIAAPLSFTCATNARHCLSLACMHTSSIIGERMHAA
jgi:hypothetical protein